MKRAILISWILSILVVSSSALFGQEVQEKKSTEAEAFEIIAKAEAKIYSPVAVGLKSLYYVQQFGMGRVKRTYWFKTPDLVKSVYGTPPPKGEEQSNVKRAVYVEQRVPDIVTRKNLGWLLGTPISFLKRFGTFQIIHKDDNGAQVRFTADTTNILEIVWTHVDFYFDGEGLLTKIHERMATDSRLEEHRIQWKPYKKDADLLVFDTITTIAGTAAWQHIMVSNYHYSEHESICLVDYVAREIKKGSKKYKDKFIEYRINEEIDDSEFEKK